MTDEKLQKSVLVVDDDPPWRETFRHRFAECGHSTTCPYEFEVDTAGSAAEGVAKVRARSRERRCYDVIVLDIRMEEEVAGILLALSLSEELGGDAPVRIIFTGHPSRETQLQAFRSRVWDYLTKEDVGDRPAARLVVDSAVERLRQLDLRKELKRLVSGGWLSDNDDRLQSEYPDRVVALWHEPEMHVIASGADAFELEDNLKDWRQQHASWQQPFILRVSAPGRCDAPAES